MYYKRPFDFVPIFLSFAVFFFDVTLPNYLLFTDYYKQEHKNAMMGFPR